MELELGLGIPKNGPILKELDLFNCKGKQLCYEDDNSTTLSCQSSVNDGDYGEEEVINDAIKDELKIIKRKRGVNEVNNEVESCVLSLLIWDDKHPNEDDHQVPKRICNSNGFFINKNEGDNLVGWPPIKSNRKWLNDGQHYHHHHQRRRGWNFPAVQNGVRGGGCGGSRTMFVKVQMEGFFITRKIDLKLYHSYEALISCLLTMFGKGQDTMDDYELTYQDRDGDWLLAGDVPWRTFIQSVQRLKLRRRDE